MRYKLSDAECTAIKPMLPNKPHGVPRVNDRRVLNGIFRVLRSGAPWPAEQLRSDTTCSNRFVRWPRSSARGRPGRMSGWNSGPRQSVKPASHQRGETPWDSAVEHCFGCWASRCPSFCCSRCSGAETSAAFSSRGVAHEEAPASPGLLSVAVRPQRKGVTCGFGST